MEIRHLETITRLGLYDCDLSSDGQWVAALYMQEEGSRLGVWAARGCDRVREIALPGQAIAGPGLPRETPSIPYSQPRFSPNGRRLAAARRGGGVTVWTLPEGREAGRIAEGGEASAHAFALRGGAIVVAQGDHLTMWAVESGEWLWSLGVPTDVQAMRASADGRLLAVGLRAGGALVVDLEARQIVASEPGIAEAVTSVAFAPTQPWLMAATAPSLNIDGERRERLGHGWAHLWNYRTGAEVVRIPCDSHAALLGGGQHLATLVDSSRALWFWRLPEAEVAARIENVAPEAVTDEAGNFQGRRVTLTATPAGDLLAVGGLSRPFSAVGVLRLYAFEAEAVPQL